jgi:hypothetical protein
MNKSVFAAALRHLIDAENATLRLLGDEDEDTRLLEETRNNIICAIQALEFHAKTKERL